MKTFRCLVLLSALAITPSLLAQGPVVARKTTVREGNWTVVRVAKWALLGAAVGFGVYALSNSRTAEHAYDELRRRCILDGTRCEITQGGYADATSESLYLRATSADRRAQVGIYGGQVAALGSVGLFIYDLRNGRGPSDIPYPAKRSVGLGVRISW